MVGRSCWRTDRGRSVIGCRNSTAPIPSAIFTRKWLRIYLYSGLKGLDINRWYVGVVRDKILTRIIRECRHEAGLPVQSKPTAAELETAWVFHGGIFYYGVRKYIYKSVVLEDKEQMISDALDVFLAGFGRVFGGRRPYATGTGQGGRIDCLRVIPAMIAGGASD